LDKEEIMFPKKLIDVLPFYTKQYLKYIYALIPPRIRYGKAFWKTYHFLQESQWWSREKLQDYQLQQLSELLHHSYENVSYYNKIFNERGLKPKDIQSFDDLKKLPFLTKEIIRKNLTSLTAKNYPKSKLQYITTGGSTGAPLGFYQEKRTSESREWAFIVNLWERVNYKIGDKIAILRGAVVKSACEGKFWEYNPTYDALILSYYHMTDNTTPNYIKKINEFRPDFLHVYPSVATILARFMKQNNIGPFASVKAVLCASEKLYSWQRILLEEVFQCRVYSFYGHAEKAVLAGECEKNTDYHLSPEYGLVELIDGNRNLTDKNDKIAEIVATGFNNFIVPFIRYRTGDLGILSNQECPCGRKYLSLKGIEGREQEFLITKEGNLMSLGPALWSIHDNYWSNIKQIQFIQEKPGILIIKIVKEQSHSKEEISEYILKLFKARFRELFKLKLDFVSHIPRSKRGKHSFLIQRLPIEFEPF